MINHCLQEIKIKIIKHCLLLLPSILEKCQGNLVLLTAVATKNTSVFTSTFCSLTWEDGMYSVIQEQE